MRIFTIKLILSRSNPQVIRELQIEDNRTIDELQDAAKTIFLDDPKSCKSVIFRINGRSVSSHSRLADVLDTSSWAQIHLSLMAGQPLDLHLEVLSLSNSPDFAGPCVHVSALTAFFLQQILLIFRKLPRKNTRKTLQK